MSAPLIIILCVGAGFGLVAIGLALEGKLGRH